MLSARGIAIQLLVPCSVTQGAEALIEMRCSPVVLPSIPYFPFFAILMYLDCAGR